MNILNREECIQIGIKMESKFGVQFYTRTMIFGTCEILLSKPTEYMYVRGVVNLFECDLTQLTLFPTTIPT